MPKSEHISKGQAVVELLSSSIIMVADVQNKSARNSFSDDDFHLLVRWLGDGIVSD